ncbi:MAG: exosortase/archaeosortase family protein [Phycisphaerae bacterium]|jgi:exosortase
MTDNNTYSWARQGRLFYIKTAVLTALFVLMFWNNIADTVSVWVKDPSWSHGFLILPFSLYLLHQRREIILSIKPEPSYIGVAWLLLMVCVYIFNIVQIRYAYGEPLIMIAALCALVYAVCGWKLMQHLWVPVLYLVFAIPIPTRLYRELTTPLRMIASQMATAIVNMLPGIEATVRGVIIDITRNGVPLDTSLNVADACSGMRLMMAFLALGVAMAYIHARPIWQKAILLGSIIPIAILCNIVRVTVTAFIYIYAGSKYAKGIYHDTLGMLMLPLALFFYWSIDWFMNNLFTSESDGDDEQKAEPEVIVRRKGK